MTRRLLRGALSVGLALLLGACSDGGDDAPSAGAGPSPVSPSGSSSFSCTASITGLPSLVPGPGGSYTFAIAIGPTCGWTARTDVSWADVSPSSGQGVASPRLTFADNPGTGGRSIDFIVNSQSFHITQSGGCTYTVAPSTLDLSPNGGSVAVTVTVIAGCPWTATASESWLRVVTPSGSGTGTAFFDAAPNSGDDRHATITVAGKRVTVTQQGS